LQPYWVLPEGSPALIEPESISQEETAPVGFIHKEGGNWRAEYSPYVPEYYTPQQRWPLIVCLHGGFGHGDEYIWTWLRPADWGHAYTYTINEQPVLPWFERVGARSEEAAR
jgi:hypothetical protein